MSKSVAFALFVVAVLLLTADAVLGQSNRPPACMSAAARSCAVLIVRRHFGNVDTPAQLLEEMRRRDLRELCTVMRSYERCFAWTIGLGPTCSRDDKKIIFSQYRVLLVQVFFPRRYVCRRINFDLFSQHKNCLLQSNSTGQLQLLQAAGSCINALPTPETPCLPPGLYQCIAEAATEQCGEEIGNSIANMGSQIDSMCPAPSGERRRDLFEFLKNSLMM